MINDFIFITSYDLKQLWVFGPWQPIKGNDSGMALKPEQFSTCTFLNVFIHGSQRQEIKTGIFIYYIFIHRHMYNWTFLMILFFSNIFMHIPLPEIPESSIFETDDLKDEGYYYVFSYFFFLFSSPLFFSFCLYLQFFSGQMWRKTELQGSHAWVRETLQTELTNAQGHSL